MKDKNFTLEDIMFAVTFSYNNKSRYAGYSSKTLENLKTDVIAQLLGSSTDQDKK